MAFKDVLKQAWEDVEAAGIPSEHRDFAFREAVKHYAERRGDVSANPRGTKTSQGPAAPTERKDNRANRKNVDTFDAIAHETDIARGDLERVFYFDGDTPAFNLSARKLGSSGADRQRTIALLIACVRYYGLDETEVDLETIRDVCIAMQSYDPANFATNMSSVPGVTLSGPRGKRVLRPRPEAKLHFKQKIASLLGTAQSTGD